MNTKRSWFWLGAGALAGCGIYRRLWRQPVLAGLPAPNPASTYAAAVAAAEAHSADNPPGLRPDCAGQLLTHGDVTDRSIVLLHGFTNCPLQYRLLAQRFFERGYNVYIPRFPYHGLYNRASKELALLTAEDLARIGSEALDIARGLGRHVTVFGLSMGGAVAAWLAQTRHDLDRAVMVAPALSFQAIPDALTPLYAAYWLRRRNRFYWWDERAKANTVGPDHAYHGFQSRGLAALVRLAVLVRQAAAVEQPRARSLVLILNPSDESIDCAGVRNVALEWRRRGANISIHEFPANWRLIHDLIDPMQPAQQIERVYPRLIEWAEYPYFVAPLAAGYL